MGLIKITNIKYYRGGSKVPERLRFNQNRSFNIANSETMSDLQIMQTIWRKMGGNFGTSPTTKIIRK